MMKVSDVLSNVADLLGKQVELKGYFLISGENGYFVDTAKDRDDLENAVSVDISDIENVVLDTVPPLGGGKYCYADSAEIVGLLSKCDNNNDFAYKISGVKSFVICRADERLSVLG